jgi:hypothetical protein
MGEQKDPQAKTAELITSSQDDILSGDKERVQKGLQTMEGIVDEADDSETICDAILGVVKTREMLDKQCTSPEDTDKSSISSLGFILEDAIEKDCLYTTPGVAERCLREIIKITPNTTNGEEVFYILKKLYNMEIADPSIGDMTRGEIFIEKVLNWNYSPQCIGRILRDIHKKEFFFTKPDFVLRIVTNSLEDKIEGNLDPYRKLFIEELLQQELLFENPKLVNQVFSILLKYGFINKLDIDWKRSLVSRKYSGGSSDGDFVGQTGGR